MTDRSEDVIRVIEVKKRLPKRVGDLYYFIWPETKRTDFNNVMTFKSSNKQIVDRLEWLADKIESVAKQGKKIAPGETKG